MKCSWSSLKSETKSRRRGYGSSPLKDLGSSKSKIRWSGIAAASATLAILSRKSGCTTIRSASVPFKFSTSSGIVENAGSAELILAHQCRQVGRIGLNLECRCTRTRGCRRGATRPMSRRWNQCDLGRSEQLEGRGSEGWISAARDGVRARRNSPTSLSPGVSSELDYTIDHTKETRGGRRTRGKQDNVPVFHLK